MVLVMQQKKDKADTIYKNVIHKVIKISGAGRATVKDMTTDKEYDRNIKMLKKFHALPPQETSGSINLEDQHESQVSKDMLTPTLAQPSRQDSDNPESNPKRRSLRDIRRPKRYLNMCEKSSESSE